jgi:diguanylate cyclase (GGDEF)-like protein
MAIENGWLYQELRQRSLHDPLTGLANLSLFHDRVEHAFARLARREGAAVAVLFLDLDDFKAVNDTLGHAGGDALLALVAERLRAVVRPEDTAARLGGDEFALLLDEVASPAEALAVARRAVDAVAAPFEITGWSVRASVSIGVAYRSVDDSTVEEMIAEADAAMYEAKRAGKGRAVPFHPGLRNAPVTAGRPVAVAARSLAVAVAAAAVARAPGYAAADRAGGGGSEEGL